LPDSISVATRENDNDQNFAIEKWQCIEIEQEAFLTARSLYNVCIFAVLLMAAPPYNLCKPVKHALNVYVHLLNDGPYLLIILYQLLFPMQDVYEMVLCTHFQKITLERCNNDYYTFTKNFLLRRSSHVSYWHQCRVRSFSQVTHPSPDF